MGHIESGALTCKHHNVYNRELVGYCCRGQGAHLVLCDDLEDGMERGTGRETQEKEMYVYLKLTHIVVQQKSTQHGKAIIFQFKII